MTDTTTTHRDVTPPRTRALVLGGGGPVGRAWQLGLASGFLQGGVDLRQAALIVGTSAGAIVGSQLALGVDVAERALVVDPALAGAPSATIATGLQRLNAACAQALGSPHPEREWQQVGQMALAAQTMSEEAALARPTLAAISGRDWPANFQATAVSVQTGRFQVWSASSGVPLVRAVASSAALPGVWPPVTLGEERYMDGGVRSMLNADLATGYSAVVVVSCFALTAPDGASEATHRLNRALEQELHALRAGGSAVELISPDEALLALTQNGRWMLNSALVPQAYEIGKRQALDNRDRIHRLWSP